MELMTFAITLLLSIGIALAATRLLLEGTFALMARHDPRIAQSR